MQDEVNPCRLLFWQPHWWGFFSCRPRMWVIRLTCDKVWGVVNHSPKLFYSTLEVKNAGLPHQFLGAFGWEGGLSSIYQRKLSSCRWEILNHVRVYFDPLRPLYVSWHKWMYQITAQWAPLVYYKQTLAVQAKMQQQSCGLQPQQENKKTKTKTCMLSKDHIGQLYAILSLPHGIFLNMAKLICWAGAATAWIKT